MNNIWLIEAKWLIHTLVNLTIIDSHNGSTTVKCETIISTNDNVLWIRII